MQKNLEFSLKKKETERVVTELKERHDQALGRRADRLRNILEQFCASERGASPTRVSNSSPKFLAAPANDEVTPCRGGHELTGATGP